LDIYKRLIDTAGEPTIKADICEMLFERDYTIFDAVPETGTTQKKKSTKRKVKKSSISLDKKRAHVTNYVAPRRKTKKH